MTILDKKGLIVGAKDYFYRFLFFFFWGGGELVLRNIIFFAGLPLIRNNI